MRWRADLPAVLLVLSLGLGCGSRRDLDVVDGTPHANTDAATSDGGAQKVAPSDSGGADSGPEAAVEGGITPNLGACTPLQLCGGGGATLCNEGAQRWLNDMSDPGADAGSADATSPDWAPDSGVEPTEPDGGTCPPVSPPAQRQVVSGEVAQVDSRCGADGGAPPLIGPVPPSTTINFDIGLPERNQQCLDTYIAEISDPMSPFFRLSLTPAETTAMFGPTECDYQALYDWAESAGFVVTATYSHRLLIAFSGTAAQIDAAFGVTLNYYLRPDGTQFYAPDQDPSLDLSVPLGAVSGVDNCIVPKSN